jgi:gamma-glutamyltranspeptidase/glutathione hydrolase
MTNGGYVSLEAGFSEKTKRELVKKGHTLQHAVGPYGGYQAIMKQLSNGVYVGASETRKDGMAAGY